MAGSIALNDLATFQFLTESFSAKEKLYVEARSNGSTPVAAARMAGYKDPDIDAMRLEDNMTMRSAVEAAVRVKSRQLEITRKDVLNGFMDAARIAGTAMEQIAAWREIGKLIGAYEPEPKPPEKDITSEDLAGMSDDELAKRAALDADYEIVDLKPIPRNAKV